MLIWVEDFSLHAWIYPFHTMLLQSVHQDFIRHLQARVEIHQILVLRGELLLWHILQCSVEVVYAV